MKCAHCGAEYEVTEWDAAFLKKMAVQMGTETHEIPHPTWCPRCRLQRRMAWHNERSLYWRTCDLTDQKLLSGYHPDQPFPVYNVETWWGDGWHGSDYARDFDFTKTFAENLDALMRVVPHQAMLVQNIENCAYCNMMGGSKDCYFAFDTADARDCYYLTTSVGCTDCVDGQHIHNCELCYECFQCRGCYQTRYSERCTDCTNSIFLMDCRRCRDCFGCVNLVVRQYCWFNEQLTKEEYERRLAAVQLDSHSQMEEMRQQFAIHAAAQPKRAYHGTSNENSTGDYLMNTKNCTSCFDVYDARDCAYCSSAGDMHDVVDTHVWGMGMELIYECETVGENVARTAFSHYVSLGSSDIYYSYWTLKSSHCFGCACLRDAKYNMLNKSYTQHEYETLVNKIIHHMKETGEWGEFLDPQISPFGYNETIAQEYFPLAEADAKADNWRWYDKPEAAAAPADGLPAADLPDTRSAATDDICAQTILCEETHRPFRIQPGELRLYAQMNTPLPRLHPDIRHGYRVAKHTPYQVWDRNCMNCGVDIQTSRAPDTPEIVWCEKCYEKEYQ